MAIAQKRHSAALLFMVYLTAAASYCQDLTPRAYVITPVHSNAIILTYNFSDGGVLFDNSIPITDATATLDVPIFSYYHSLSFCRELLAHPEKIAQAHEHFADKIGCITLEPVVTEQGKRMYMAHGKVDFFGEEGVAHSGGAGGPPRTM